MQADDSERVTDLGEAWTNTLRIAWLLGEGGCDRVIANGFEYTREGNFRTNRARESYGAKHVKPEKCFQCPGTASWLVSVFMNSATGTRYACEEHLSAASRQLLRAAGEPYDLPLDYGGKRQSAMIIRPVRPQAVIAWAGEGQP